VQCEPGDLSIIAFHLRRRHRRKVPFGSRPRGEAPQQMLFAVEQIQQRPLRSAAGLKIGRAPPGIGNAVAVPVDCRSSLRKTPASFAPTREKWIRPKWLRLLESKPRIQAITWRRRRIS